MKFEVCMGLLFLNINNFIKPSVHACIFEVRLEKVVGVCKPNQTCFVVNYQLFQFIHVQYVVYGPSSHTILVKNHNGEKQICFMQIAKNGLYLCLST